MVKTIAYFPSQVARNAPPVLAAVAQALGAHGLQLRQDSLDCDAVVLWSVLWQGRMKPNREVYQHYRDTGRPVIVIDVGSLLRGTTWKIALNHVNAQGHYAHTQNLDNDRPARLGIGLKKFSSRRPEILVAMQNHRSLQTEEDQSTWLQNLINDLRVYTDRPIMIRPHPRSALQSVPKGERIGIQMPKLIAGTYDDFDIGYDYHVVCNHNSGPGIQAALAGTPVLVHRTSLAYPLTITASQVEHPPMIDRDQWLIEICHTEWLLAEIAQGIWLSRLGLLQ